VLFSSNADLLRARDSLSVSLGAVYDFLRFLGLELAPDKSKSIVFTRRTRCSEIIQPFSVEGTQIPIVDSVRFLGVTLDHRLSDALHLRFLLVKGHRVLNIITSLSGVWWGAHPSLLLSLYRLIFRSSIEYGA